VNFSKISSTGSLSKLFFEFAPSPTTLTKLIPSKVQTVPPNLLDKNHPLEYSKVPNPLLILKSLIHELTDSVGNK